MVKSAKENIMFCEIARSFKFCRLKEKTFWEEAKKELNAMSELSEIQVIKGYD